MSKGIDVSRHNGAIDWKSVKDDGVEFAIIRAGYGKVISQKDAWFERNYQGCADNGIPCGAYWYSYALTPAEAEAEARVFLEAIKGKQFLYPVYLDIEEKMHWRLVRRTSALSSRRSAPSWRKPGTGAGCMRQEHTSRATSTTNARTGIPSGLLSGAQS